MVQIRFIDAQGQTTNDYVAGIPIVEVEIQVLTAAQVSAAAANGQLNFQPKKYNALVDTGADHVIIDDSIAAGIVPKYNIPGINVGVVINTDIYDAALLIHGIGTLHMVQCGTQPLLKNGARAPILLGRSILANYKLVFDPPNGNFTLV